MQRSTRRVGYRAATALLTAIGILGACGTETIDRGITDPASAGALVPASSATPFSEWSLPVALNSRVNTPALEMGPALSKDGLALYFGSTRTGSLGADIWVTRRASLDEDWGDPQPVPALNSSGNDNVPSLSRDQHWLFFTSTRLGGEGGNDVWVSYREDVHDDFRWQSPVNLGPNVNTPANEAGPSFLEDDEGGPAQLFFNRVVPNREAEIYVSEQAPDGSFGTATAVDPLNTTFTEQRPSIHRSGLDIYFFSNRPSLDCPAAPCSNDIWLSAREGASGAWSDPANLGSPINTTASETHPHIFSHGRVEELYFARAVLGHQDILVSRRTRGAKP